VDFGQRPWWYRGHFCKKAGKILEKRLFPKEIILKKRKKKLGVGQKYEINYA
jgi:hypothetical protein